jgi:Uncharacterised protein family (UPF0175)
MNVTVPIPDELAARLGEAGDLSRLALEAFAAEEYRAGRLTHPELRSLLGFATHAELDGFLKARAIFEDYTQQDLDRDRQTLDRLGL